MPPTRPVPWPWNETGLRVPDFLCLYDVAVVLFFLFVYIVCCCFFVIVVFHFCLYSKNHSMDSVLLYLLIVFTLFGVLRKGDAFHGRGTDTLFENPKHRATA